MRVRKTKQQLVNTDPGKTVRLAKQSIVCSAVKLEEIIELGVVLGQPLENARLAGGRGDETVRIVLPEPGKVWNQTPPRRASSSCRTRMNAGTPPRIM